MSRYRCARFLSLMLVAAMPLGALAPACSSNTSTAGQRITCADHGAGPVDCHPVQAHNANGSGTDGSGSGSGTDTCEDVDEDGDGTPHDEGEEHHGGRDGSSAGAEDDDDDDDGIENDRDCDKRHGGDDADDDDGSDGSGHDGSGSGTDDDRG